MTIQNLSRINRLHRSASATFGDVIYQPGGTCGPRMQLDFQLVVLYSGALQVRVDEQLHVIPPQSVIVMRPGHQEFFQFALDQPTHHAWCAVQPAVVPAPLDASLANTPVYLPLTQSLQQLLEFGLSLPPSDLSATQDVLRQIGLAALYEFVRVSETAHSTNHLPEAVVLARQWIDEHFAESLTLDTIARVASVTPQHLIRLFSKYLRITPARYLWQVRLERGLSLLRDTGLSVGEISARSGFQSAFHFSRLIKQRYQLSPRALRAQMWQHALDK